MAWSFLIDLTDININKKEVIKYKSPGSLNEAAKDLSSNKFSNPKIKVRNKILNTIIWTLGFLNKKILIITVSAKISE